jgi:signal transduction histidine kinase
VGQSERGYALLFVRPAGRLRVVVSSPNLSLADTLSWMQDEALRELLPILAPVFIGALLITPLTIRRSLIPLDRLSAQAALIEPAHTDVRLKEEEIPSEILPLVQKINEALARIDEGFELQRRFTSNAAHELRTPLAILRARIDGLDEGPAKAGLARDIDRMTRLVGQLLLAGRLEMPEAASVAPIDLGEIARETVERLRLLPVSHEHALHLELPRTPIIVRGEAESLGDALRNLIDNAIAYSPAGSAVDIAVTPDAGLEVRDRGSGIAASDRERIFERFWRGRKPMGEGAGLGLSIVKSIITRHGGSVSIRENPGGGTIFRLQFPRLGSDPSQPAVLVASSR